MPVSLREAVRKRILVDSLKSVQSPGKWKVLVVEENALRILNSVCDLHDLSDVNVPVTEPLTRSRTPYPDKEAIYFITPSVDAIKALINDFRGPKPMYSAAHIFCISGLPDPLFDMIKASPARNYIQALKELNIDFTPVESQVYHFNDPTPFTKLRNVMDVAQLDRWLEQIAEQMKSVLWTLEDCPTIRYFDPSGKSDSLSAHMAFKLQKAIDQLKDLDPEWPPTTPYAPAQILVLDRSVDPFAPLIHTLTYQAAAHDILQIDGTKVTYSKDDTTTQTAVLDESDGLYKNIRHHFIADAWKKILETKNKLDAESSAIESSENALKRIEQLKIKLFSLPDAQKTLEKVALHIHLYAEIMQAVNDRQLDEVASIEQIIVTGETPNGDGITETLINDVLAILESPNVSLQDKLRLILTYALGVSNVDCDRLIEAAQLGREAAALNGLDFLGRTPALIEANSPQWRYTDLGRKAEARRQKKKNQDTDEQPFDIHRYVPALKYILQDMITGKLDSAIFPPTVVQPSIEINGTSESSKSAHQTPGRGTLVAFTGDFKPTWGKRKPATGAQTNVDLRTNGSRIIVLFVDGLSFAEVRVAYEVTSELQREVIIGSTNLVTPTEFIGGLCDLGATGRKPFVLPPVKLPSREPISVPRDRPLPQPPQELQIPAMSSVLPSPPPEIVEPKRVSSDPTRTGLVHSKSSSSLVLEKSGRTAGPPALEHSHSASSLFPNTSRLSPSSSANPQRPRPVSWVAGPSPILQPEPKRFSGYPEGEAPSPPPKTGSSPTKGSALPPSSLQAIPVAQGQGRPPAPTRVHSSSASSSSDLFSSGESFSPAARTEQSTDGPSRPMSSGSGYPRSELAPGRLPGSNALPGTEYAQGGAKGYQQAISVPDATPSRPQANVAPVYGGPSPYSLQKSRQDVPPTSRHSSGDYSAQISPLGYPPVKPVDNPAPPLQTTRPSAPLRGTGYPQETDPANIRSSSTDIASKAYPPRIKSRGAPLVRPQGVSPPLQSQQRGDEVERTSLPATASGGDDMRKGSARSFEESRPSSRDAEEEQLKAAIAASLLESNTGRQPPSYGHSSRQPADRTTPTQPPNMRTEQQPSYPSSDHVVAPSTPPLQVPNYPPFRAQSPRPPLYRQAAYRQAPLPQSQQPPAQNTPPYGYYPGQSPPVSFYQQAPGPYQQPQGPYRQAQYQQAPLPSSASARPTSPGGQMYHRSAQGPQPPNYPGAPSYGPYGYQGRPEQR
ncbi:uncharacterized protein SPPG_01051 [Spizellomyces punctatus DAOM BR117]|uniref:Sec1-like protein n=1 Tax=Spizellomyces punctatus (strain DAOM BR117) TaxID=645134 RepID=A0A0L0HQC0_SPIPD|nr:uncharacterized protein SPPG_01051 [Spizellomyces punctatus DAOM BR117]KND03576.1 hypothetical protein SPPG_01051 [Spizellomyces punctatus DAOM BR117]|eukprot:XP_016611615.1 hypothetical protein SPPG_01051 [Spizellomyces punctatus DAOM BR117]